MTLAHLFEGVLGPELPVGLRAYDGTRLGPPDPPATIVIRRPEAFRRIITARGELGFARAYVAGDIDIEGDIFAALELGDRLPEVRLRLTQKLRATREVGIRHIWPLPPPTEEARLSGRRFTRRRRASALAHHYDIPDEFFRLFLGRTMAYTCAVFNDASDGLDEAQDNKYELVARKLALQPDMRLLDVGCGWGGMLVHAAQRHGVQAVGVSMSQRQVDWARNRCDVDARLSGMVKVRCQDYRDIDDGPYDAISTMGVFEHIGFRGGPFFPKLHSLLRPGGRLLHHAISQPPFRSSTSARHSFIQRYVFPDSELHELGVIVTAIQKAGFEVRHTESLREHYVPTLRHWVANLEENWDAAVSEVGVGRARVWRLYMAAFARNFESNDAQVHQVLAVRPTTLGRSEIPLGHAY